MTFKDWVQMIEDYALFAEEPFLTVSKWYSEWWEQKQSETTKED